MITRMGHVALRVPDLDASVAFAEEVLGLREVERAGGDSYLTCNERHHELILRAGQKAGYEHVALEVSDADGLEQVLRRAEGAGARRLGSVEGEPGIEGGALLAGPNGHVFKLFHGMATGQPVDGAGERVRPVRFEHVSFNVRDKPGMERFLQEGLGLEFSDRIGATGAWFRPDEIHHGVALLRTPVVGLAHYAFELPSFDAFRVVCDRLVAQGRKIEWGPGRHGPGNNVFLYFFDPAGALIELTFEMAKVGPGHQYEPSHWPLRVGNISRWGGFPPPRFLFANHPRVEA
jgi:catechol 2,3-dioxygenase-like lactoylglutathione lyase family enzyme